MNEKAESRTKSSTKEVVMHNSIFGTFPFPYAKSDHDYDSEDQSKQCADICPGIQSSSERHSGEEKTQSNSKQESPDKIKVRDFLPERQVIVPRMSLGRLVANEDEDD